MTIARKILAACLLALPAVRADAATTTGTATLTVVAPLSVQELIPMNFGTFVPSGSPGTVGTDGFANNVTVILSATPGVFRATGQQGANYNVTGSPTCLLASAGHTMTASLNYPPVAGTLGNVSGFSNFLVEGSLAVGASQPAGNYSGTYTVTVNY